MRLAPALRDRLGVALLPAAALAVHELRYRLAFGADAAERLDGTGHGYLAPLVWLAGVVAALVAGRWLVRTAREWGGDGRGQRARVLWARATLTLLALYTAQEAAEGALAGGHPDGLAGVFGDGGLWAVPAALLVGGLLTLVLAGAARVERTVAAARPALVVALPVPALTLEPAHALVRVAAGARSAPRGRAPPFT